MLPYISTPEPQDLLPHNGPMVLIDKIDHWNDNRIQCSTNTHLDDSNPLRDQGRLSVYAGVEYAAQAMAAHAQLTQRSTQAPGKGFLAAASKLEANIAALDQFPQELIISAWALAQNPNSSMYQFVIECGTRRLLEGRLTAVITMPTTGS